MDDNPYQPPESDVEVQPTEPSEGLPPLPWENREQIGFAAGLWETFILFLKDPVQAYARAKDSGDYNSPLIYAIIMGTVGGVIGYLWSMLFNLGTLGMLGDESVPALGFLYGMGALAIIFVPIQVVIGIFIWSGIVHVCLLITGGLPDSKGGFEGTLRSISYGYSTQPLQIVPILGAFIAGIWSIVLYVIGLKRMHGVSTGRAIAVIFLPIVLCCVIILGIAILAGGLAALSSQ